MNADARIQIIKEVALSVCEDREQAGFSILSESDVQTIINKLDKKGVKLTHEEMIILGFNDDNNSL